jgi:aminoacylase
MLNAGVTSDHGETYALNVIPSEAEAGFDVRIPPSVPLDEMERLIKSWCDPEHVEVTFVQKVPEHNVTDISEKNEFWKVFTGTFEQLNLKIVPEIFPAGTDSRYLRAANIPAFGFSPMQNTPILLHDNDERLAVDVFLKGVKIFTELVKNMANLE